MNKKTLTQSSLALAVALFVFAGSGAAQTKRPKVKPKAKPQAGQTSDKVTYSPDAEMLAQMRGQITIVESKKDWATFNRQRPVNNPTGNRTAYVAQFAIEAGGNAVIDVVVVYDKAADKFYEIRGFDFPRPFEDLKWTDNDTLQFDQWVNPTRGGRYRVNVKTGKLVAAGYVEDK